MEHLDEQDKKNRRIAWITSLSIQLILLVVFYFIIAWKAPFPPIPEYGIEIGFASSEGAESLENVSTGETLPQETEQESSKPLAADTEQETTSGDEIEEAAVEEIEPVETTNEAESESTSTREEVPKDVEETTPENASPSDHKESETSQNETVDENETDSEPAIDERALYGGGQGTSENKGSSDGASLSLAGWIWDFKPKPEDTSSEVGKIVYKIVVDADGYLVQIETITSTVSPSVERVYRQAVEKLTFSKTSDYQPAPLSTGTLTFVIQSK